MLKNVCRNPFFTAEIFSDGSVYLCCPDYMNIGSIGNVFEQSWDEIWNSDIAKNFRERILHKDYSMCKQNFCEPNFFPLCHELNSPYITTLDFQNPKLKVLKISTDKSCQTACIICRDKLYCNNDAKQTQWLNEQIASVFMPILKDVEIVNFCGSGDPFASKHFRYFIKEISKNCPHIKFDLHTNGVLCDERNLEELGILDKLSTIQISLHSATKETYDKIVKYGNWERLNKNLEFLYNLKKEGKLFELQLNFVITSVNYKDIPIFIDLCKKYGAKAFLWQYRDLFGGDNYDERNICSPIHTEHSDFIQIMTSDKVKNAKNVFMSPLLRKYTQIKDVEQYNILSTILMDVITERYESKYCSINRRFKDINTEINKINQDLNKKRTGYLSKIFSIKNSYKDGRRYKKITMFGIKTSFYVKEWGQKQC